jgi:DnaJ-class molecular chaperone
MRCKLCNGGKKIIGMGCMEQSCPECDGKGVQPEQKEVTKEIEIVKPPYKRPSRANSNLQSRIKNGEPLKVVLQNAK